MNMDESKELSQMYADPFYQKDYFAHNEYDVDHQEYVHDNDTIFNPNQFSLIAESMTGNESPKEKSDNETWKSPVANNPPILSSDYNANNPLSFLNNHMYSADDFSFNESLYDATKHLPNPIPERDINHHANTPTSRTVTNQTYDIVHPVPSYTRRFTEGSLPKYEGPSRGRGRGRGRRSSTNSHLNNNDIHYKLNDKTKMVPSDNGNHNNDRRKHFLERNRQAALECRQRKKQWLSNLQQRVEYLSTDNDQLQTQADMLREEIINLKTLLLTHRDCKVAQKNNQTLFTNSLSSMNMICNFQNDTMTEVPYSIMNTLVEESFNPMKADFRLEEKESVN